MTLPVPTIQLFENEEVQMIQDGDNIGVTTECLARIFQKEEKHINEAIRRNFELFDGLTFSRMMRPDSRSKTFTCLTRDGVLTLITLLDYKRYPDDIRDKIIRFRRWMTETVGKVLDQKIPTVPAQLTPGQIAMDYLNIGHAMHTLYGVPLGIAGAVSINLAEDASGMDLTAYKRILPPAPEVDTPYLNATQIGARVGLSAAAVNRFLSIQGLIYMGEKGWRMTKEGHEYGGSFPYARNGHTDYQIRWKESVLDLFPGGKQARLEGLAY